MIDNKSLIINPFLYTILVVVINLWFDKNVDELHQTFPIQSFALYSNSDH